MKRITHFVTLVVTVSLAFCLFILSGCTNPAPTKTVTPDANGIYPTRSPHIFYDTDVPTKTMTPYGHIPGVGDDIRDDYLIFRLESVDVITHLETAMPKNGYVFLSCYVKLRNYYYTALDFGPNNFKVIDNLLNSYTPIPLSLDPPLSSGILALNKNRTGYITFEVPASAHSLMLYFEASSNTNHLSIKASLGR